MRDLFETGTVKEVEIDNHIITMDSLKRFVVRQAKTGFLVITTSSIESYEWVRNFAANQNNNQWA